MHSLAILPANHAVLASGLSLGTLPQIGWDSLDGIAVGMVLASIGFAANSARRGRSCPLPPVGSQAAAEAPRLSRVRQRVDGVLTGILSDDADRLTQAPAGSRASARSAAVTEQRFQIPSMWRGDYVDALPARRHASTHPYPETLANEALAGGSGPDVGGAPATAARGREDARPLPSPEQRRRDAVQRFLAAPVVDLETAREVRATGHAKALSADSAGGTSGAGEQPEVAADDAKPTSGDPVPGGKKPGGLRADESFWGPCGSDDDAAGSIYRSRHRLDGSVKDKPQDGRKTKPRHAAPPASFGVTLTRRLTGARLTSRSAAHAG